jgi:N-acetylneuraminic acid mutarotase
VFTFTQLSNFPGIARDNLVAFVYNNKAYVGMGGYFSTYYSDMWRYDPGADSWTALDTFPGVKRRNAMSFTLGNYGYVGMGYGKSGSIYTDLSDFWRYDMANDTWTQLNNITVDNGENEGVTAFVVNGKAYMIGNNKKFWEYDPSGDSWSLKSTFTGLGRSYTPCFVIGNKVFYGSGYDSSEEMTRPVDFWVWDATTNVWTQIANFPSVGRSSAVSFALSGYGIVGTGNNFYSYFKDFYYYNPSTNVWTVMTDYPAGNATGLTSFVINDVSYLGIRGTNKFYKLSKTN